MSIQVYVKLVLVAGNAVSLRSADGEVFVNLILADLGLDHLIRCIEDARLSQVLADRPGPVR
jgi:hypothetical protein